MRPKCFELIRLLMEKPSNAQRLSEHLSVSLRSIKNYVKEINDEVAGTITSSNKGYEINHEKALSILSETQKDIPQVSAERVYFIITKLLNSYDNKPLNVFDLSDELFVSSSTLRNDIVKVKRKIAQFDLNLVYRGDWITVEGLERDKRKLLSHILYEESSVNFVNLESLQNTFTDVDIEYIKSTIQDILIKHHYFINDYSLINLVLHVSITINRIQNQSISTIEYDDLQRMYLHEHKIAQEITDIFSQEYQIIYSHDEVNELALLIASRATSLDYQSITKATIQEYIGEECVAIVNHLIEYTDNFYQINLFDDDFIVRFALHIRNLLVRSKNNQLSKNPLADGIKKSCPLIYEISVNVASELMNICDVTLNDDEIAYIAFHIGSAAEIAGSMKEKLRIIYYCPNYYNIHNKVIEFVKEHFDKEVFMVTIVTDESQISELSNIDFILTSIPIAALTLIPIVQISIFPNDNDRILLTNTISDIRKEKTKKEFEYHLRELITPALFEVNHTIQDSDTCLSFMAEKLITLDYANEEFYREVLGREAVSSTAFSGAAIPHSMSMNAKKTGLSILISQSGISWNDATVHLVIMMCFNKNERNVFNEIFEPITMILAEKTKLNALVKVQNYEEFIECMVSLL